MQNYEDRKAMTIKMSALIEKLKDEYDRENYLNDLYEITKIRKRQTLREQKTEYNGKVTNANVYVDGLTKAEYTILSQIAMSYKALDTYQRQLGFLLDEDHQKLAMLIIDDYRKNSKCSLARIYDETEEDRIRNLIADLSVPETLPNEYDEESLNGAIARVKNEVKQKRIADLKEKISKTAAVDPEKADEYLKEYEKLIKELGGDNG
jgi:hypothetical protein